jgi:c-di-GMP-binding flagellar brake protein YcgR
MTDLSSFAVQNPKQIVSYLSLLIKNKCLLSACFGANNESFITTLLFINEKNNTLVLDYGPKEDLNQNLLNAEKVLFDTDYNGIKISFTGIRLTKITHNGEPAFSMTTPKSLFWMQRREYYRVKSPLSNPDYCQLIIANRDPINLKLYDISLSGCALLNVSKDVSELMIPGTTINQCKLILLGAGESRISIEVSAKYMINHEKLHKIQKIGCKFVKLAHPVEEVLQSYIQQIQREDLKK